VKRSGPLRRRTPLPRGTRGLVRVPLTIRGRRSAGWHRSRQWCFDRAHGRCEAHIAAAACTGRAEHAHHILMRSQGGSDDPANLLAVCHGCHRWIHDHTGWAYERGFLRRMEAS
jgi:hypothetical protein